MEIARVKPKIIVCLGKQVFDMVADQKISFDDAHGCWFWSKRYQAHLYVMYAPYTLIGKPEYYETFRVDFREIARRRDLLAAGHTIAGDDVRYEIIRNQQDLEDWLERLEELTEEDRWPGQKDENGNPLIAVDCEWHGLTFVDGDLRTIQFAWSDHDAVVIEFRDEQREWSFQLDDEVAPDNMADWRHIQRIMGYDEKLDSEKPQEKKFYDASKFHVTLPKVLGKPVNTYGIDMLDREFITGPPHYGLSQEYLTGLDELLATLEDVLEEESPFPIDEEQWEKLARDDRDWRSDHIEESILKADSDDEDWRAPDPRPPEERAKAAMACQAVELEAYRKWKEAILRAARQIGKSDSFRAKYEAWVKDPLIENEHDPDVLLALRQRAEQQVGPIGLTLLEPQAAAPPTDENTSYEACRDSVAAHTARAKLEQAIAENPMPMTNLLTDGKDINKLRYKAIGQKIEKVFRRMKVRYIGHHFSADSVWMRHWLGMETYNLCEMDTEFAQQTVDESSELGLERGIAMKYTNLGRYDFDLVMWKRENKPLCKDGYGYIPSSILHPYGAKDVIAPLRAYPLIKNQLVAQRLWDYYRDILNPYISNIFTEFVEVGLPMDIPLLDELRSLYGFAVRKLNAKLQERIHTEAKAKLRQRIINELGVPAFAKLIKSIDAKDEETLRNEIKAILAAQDKLAEVNSWMTMISHFIESQSFNIRSPDQMRRWLFDVEKLTPIKSTNQKAKNLPSMAWEAVLELPEDRQSQYTPAVDKQTLQILSEQLPAIDQLLDLNAVGNVAKGFLKEASIYIDEETGEEEVEEHGLHAWIASDGRIHPNYSLTETSRSRCLPGDAQVLTSGRGLVPLKDVSIDDLVWDGEEWVEHDGVIEQGVQRVYEYQGLWATLNHQVWVYNDSAAEMGLGIGSDEDVLVEKVDFGTAIQCGLDLVPGEDGLDVSALDRYDGIPVDTEGEDPQRRPNKTVMTYDLLNAGPNRRFTCDGSSYS